MKFPTFKKKTNSASVRSSPKRSIRASFILARDTLVHLVTFLMLLLIYITALVFRWLGKKKYFPAALRRTSRTCTRFYERSVLALDNHQAGSVSRVTLIDLSIRNMRAKGTRTLITIGGMAVGIGATVFLVSIGYGLQELVVSRVARLDEMKQADVTVQPGSKVRINDKTLADFMQTTHVTKALPMISVVGRINFNSSVSDVAVYGVTSDYLQQSAIKPVLGKIFDSNDLVVSIKKAKGDVAGVSTTFSPGDENDLGKLKNTSDSTSALKVGDTIQEVEFSYTPDVWSRVREQPSSDSKIIGYTRRQEGKQKGTEVWGGTYISDDGSGEAGTSSTGEKLGKWLKVTVPVWSRESCEVGTIDCEDGDFLAKRDDDHNQVQVVGYVAELNLSTLGISMKESQVLGVSTASDSASTDFVEIASEEGVIKQIESKKVKLGSNAKRQAIVNRALLKVLGIKESESIGKVFSTSFIATGDLLDSSGEKIESIPAEYTIIGVTPDEKTPVIYVPFIDLRSLGITNYSQVKVVVVKSEDLTQARKKVEALGYITRSVADTVNQINSLFSTARTVLALLGMVALGVAALGMFNTLTVSLLERTREVGLMKAMGMKSHEVQELFLTESMTMGLFGGMFGLLIGFLGGKFVGLVLSIFAIGKGVGYIDVSYIPPLFVLIILFLSLFVGLVTGIYPARRATKISALNALRYE